MIARSKTARNSGVSILSRVLDFANGPLSPSTAQAFTSLKFPKSDERRMNQLAAKAQSGSLTDAERFEAEEYNSVSHLVAYLQAKSHQTVKRDRRKSKRA
jgi:hypothetical protein